MSKNKTKSAYSLTPAWTNTREWTEAIDRSRLKAPVSKVRELHGDTSWSIYQHSFNTMFSDKQTVNTTYVRVESDTDWASSFSVSLRANERGERKQ